MSTAIDLPPKPVPPEPGDCCGSGCARCVNDIYDEELERWRALVAEREREAAQAPDTPVAGPAATG